MKTLTLKNKLQTNTTLVSNDFIDHYMVAANGEFVKVYLFLLRHMDDPNTALSVSKIADCLNNTEGDIIRAFRYWESEGLLALDTDADGNIISICLERNQSPAAERTCASLSEAASVSPASKTDTGSAADQNPKASVDKPSAAKFLSKAIPLDSFRAQKELKNLYMIAEQYLGKTLTAIDIEAITYFYKDLGLTADVIEYLLASCVENGHKSIHYIQSVAISWSKAGIRTVEDARQRSANYHKNCYTVLNAFGIKGRAPAPTELSFIERWSNEYGFSLDIIQEACNRTISVTHQPSFEYADKILKKWLKSGVKHLQDIQALDEAFQKNRAEHKTKPVKPVAKNLNNFERRSYDMDSLEERLLNSN